MQPVKVIVSNELSNLSVLQAAAGAFVGNTGASLSEVRQMELVVEEIFTNILKFEYLPEQRETIALELDYTDGELVTTISFKGIPFDTGYLKQCEQVKTEDLLTGEVHGIGMQLLRQFSDALEYRNLGSMGQQIFIRRILDLAGPTEARLSSVLPIAQENTIPPQIVVRRMLPSESAAVSRLAYFAYGYTYAYEHIYDPEQVRLLNASDKLISYVVVEQNNNVIVGHGALVPDGRSGLYEMGVGFVNPYHRSSGCMNELTPPLIGEAQRRGAGGVFVTAVTTHPYSQKPVIKYGMRESALLVSRVESPSMRALNEQPLARESFLLMVRLFDDTPRGHYHAPAEHRQMLHQIVTHLGMVVPFNDNTVAIDLPETGLLEQECDHYQCGHIHLQQYGNDSLPEVQRILHGWCLDRLETVYLYLPLLQPATAVLNRKFETLGFIFSGLQPRQSGDDRLVLQYFNNQRNDYSRLKAATGFGQQLIDYIRDRDPNRSAQE